MLLVADKFGTLFVWWSDLCLIILMALTSTLKYILQHSYIASFWLVIVSCISFSILLLSSVSWYLRYVFCKHHTLIFVFVINPSLPFNLIITCYKLMVGTFGFNSTIFLFAICLIVFCSFTLLPSCWLIRCFYFITLFSTNLLYILLLPFNGYHPKYYHITLAF